ncbi:MAG TPA: hypothetical protein VNE39_03590 [Planctomycetota bacterium]|nr:hypothetical protein [Planctomycetota bacterium]
MADDAAALERQLNDFDREKRRAAIQRLAELVRAGRATVPPLTGAVNVHFHTFFSFHYLDWSPSRIVWEAKKTGLDVAGSVDFDVLDAMDEMFEAGEVLEVRTNVALETRVFAPEFPDWEFSSPGEPGILYFMGTGFTRLPEPGTPAAACLDAMRAGARARNEEMIERLRSVIAPMEVDYEADVLPLTPSGNATERHMLAVLDTKARAMFPEADRLAAYWSERSGLSKEEIGELLGDTAKFRTAIRSKLMKKGGPGYMPPDPAKFPQIRDVVQMIRDVDALPCATWLDGTRRGEADPDALLDWFLDMGCPVLNIVPDRNWNLADPADKKLKTQKLAEIVAAARKRHLPFSVGTEMNNYGQKFVDTFDAPELRPYAADFRDGGYILYAHTLLQRACGKGLMSEWARDIFKGDRAKANAFYLDIGRRAFPPRNAREQLAERPAPR